MQGLIETTASSGEIQLRVGQKILKTFPAQQAGEFAIDLDEPARTLLADAENGGRLSVGARWVPEDSAGRCLAAQPEEVSLSGMRIKVEGEAAGDMVRHDGLMHMHGPLRTTGRAAGEVQQGHVFGPRPHGLERVRCRRHRGGRGGGG